MSCRDIRLKFSEALDAPRDAEDRLQIESHCAACAICGPEWRTLLRLEELMMAPPAPPAGFADRVMAAIPTPAPARREIMPFAAAGLIAAAALVALQLATVASATAPWLAPVRDLTTGLTEIVRARVASSPWEITGWVLAGAATVGALSGAVMGRVRQVVG
ncbi:MAG: hypothetical protein AAB074_12270 [Planctomycetota bacterium]